MNLMKLVLPLNESERNRCANLSNCSAALYQTLNESSDERQAYQRCNWLGFYLLPEGSRELVLGPFQGRVAVVRIPVGKGVCGVSAQTKKVQLVKNVHECKEHIACDPRTRSEVVVPIILDDGRLVAVLDIDSEHVAEFDEEDVLALQEHAKTIAAACDWH